MAMEYFLGIDQGGTKTAAIICNINGSILGKGMDDGLSSVYFNDADELYIKRIVSAAANACAMAGITLDDISQVCGGLSGADWDFEYPILTERLSRALYMDVAFVLNDCIAAMRGGSPNRECAVVCAGSGLNAAVRRGDGEEIIYGYYIDNAHQGGGALGTAALRKIMEAHLGLCGDTALTGLILGYTGHSTAEELLIALSTEKYRLEHKALAPLLAIAYSEGDREAGNIVDTFSRAVARYVTVAMGRLCMSGRKLDMVFSGGVFKGQGVLIADRIYDLIAEAEPGTRKIHAKYEPVCGAALTLLDGHWGGEPPDEVMAAFGESAAAHGLLRDIGEGH